MGYQRDRDEFISALTRRLSTEPPHIAAAIARHLLRHATTLQRYAEAQCNGEWPFDNGERKTRACARCEGGCHPAAMRDDKTAPKVWPPYLPGREIDAIFVDRARAEPAYAAALEADPSSVEGKTWAAYRLMKKRPPQICPDCRTQDIVTAILTPWGLKPYFQGDPRGAVFQIFEQHISPDLIHNGRERGLYVPAR